MGEQTKIAWCDHTFNPWIGCAKVASGCVNCYAQADFGRRRHRAKWGPQGTRSLTNATNWEMPWKWNLRAEHYGLRQRVFCGSLCDVFEDWQGPIFRSAEIPIVTDLATRTKRIDAHHGPGMAEDLLTMNDVRRDLFALIDRTPHLDWLLLTKRPENINRMWPEHVDKWPTGPWRRAGDSYRPNIWLGCSCSTQDDLGDNLPHLLACRDLTPVLFLSLEPLLSWVDIRPWITPLISGRQLLDWVIVGGESGPHARPCHEDNIRNVVRQCQAANVPCFVKQMGSHALRSYSDEMPIRIGYQDLKGGNPDEWPADVRVREFPKEN